MTYRPRTASGAAHLAHLARVGALPTGGAAPLARAPRTRAPRPGGAPLATWSATPRPVPDPYRPRMLARAAMALAPRRWTP